jgi:hypothetical protein
MVSLLQALLLVEDPYVAHQYPLLVAVIIKDAEGGVVPDSGASGFLRPASDGREANASGTLWCRE